METIIYKGYTIREATSPWAKMYGYFWEANNDEKVYQFQTLDEAYSFIDERTNK